MGIPAKELLLYSLSGICFLLCIKGIRKHFQLSKKLNQMKNRKELSPKKLLELFDEGKIPEIEKKGEKEKIFKGVLVYGKSCYLDNIQSSDLILHKKIVTYLFSNNCNKIVNHVSAFPFKLENLEHNDTADGKSVFVSVHPNDKVKCLIDPEKLEGNYTPNKLSLMENFGLVFAYSFLWIFTSLKMSLPLKNIFIGVNNEEFGIKLGAGFLVYGDLIYNCNDKTMRIEHPLKFLNFSNFSNIILKMEGKIVKNKIKMAVYAILAVGCLYMAKISFKNNKRKNQSQRIMKISYNEKHITTQGEDFRCMICRMNQKNIILHPCSHLVMCKVCLQNNKEKVKSCPLCKHHYTETIEILIP